MKETSHSPQVITAGGTYHAGTLSYTRGGLLVLSFWLLWGDFAFNFFESVFGRFLPIYLKELNASNTLIGLMAGSFAGLVNVLFLPGISRWNDRFRTRIGRRIPLLYVTTPLTVAALVAIGFAPEIGGGLFQMMEGRLPAAVSEGGTILALMCLLTVSYHFFNMLLVNGYNWLIRDVVPLAVMSRFLAWFRIVGVASGTLFLWFVFPHLMTHRKEIFLSVGLFYLVAFLLMCLNVREGEYPPPDKDERHRGVLGSYVIYFKECLQIPLYRHFFLVSFLVMAALSCAGNFVTLFARETLGLGMDSLGHIFAWTSAVSVVFFYPMGWLCDRFSPMHVALVSIAVMCLGALLAPFLVTGHASYLAYSVLFSLPAGAWYLSQTATAMKLFPSEKFGQFSGALNVFGCGSLIVGNFLIGVIMDLAASDYRVAFFWMSLIAGSALWPMVLVIRGWKRHGGPGAYSAPVPTVVGH